MALLDVKKMTFKFKDGGSNELEMQVLEGAVEWTQKRNVIFVKNRGRLSSVRIGDQIPVDVNMNLKWEFLKSVSGESLSPEDVLKQRGEAAAWASSDADACRPYAVDIEMNYVPDCGAAEDELIVLNDFRYEKLACDLRNATLKVTGKANVTRATVTRS